MQNVKNLNLALHAEDRAAIQRVQTSLAGWGDRLPNQAEILRAGILALGKQDPKEAALLIRDVQSRDGRRKG